MLHSKLKLSVRTDPTTENVNHFKISDFWLVTQSNIYDGSVLAILVMQQLDVVISVTEAVDREA